MGASGKTCTIVVLRQGFMQVDTHCSLQVSATIAQLFCTGFHTSMLFGTLMSLDVAFTDKCGCPYLFEDLPVALRSTLGM